MDMPEIQLPYAVYNKSPLSAQADLRVSGAASLYWYLVYGANVGYTGKCFWIACEYNTPMNNY